LSSGSDGLPPGTLSVHVDLATWTLTESWATASSVAGGESHVEIVFDARLDNEAALRATLALPEAPLGELLAAAYLTWGEGVAAKLNGDFAIVFRDRRLRKVVAIRDQLGIRPLYYRVSGREIHLADSVRPLMINQVRPTLDDGRIVEYLVGAYKTTESTFFRDIRELPAGHLLVASADGVKVRRYWSPVADGSTGARATREESREEFRRLFIASVERRLTSASPVVLHVSGGLDSSSIAGATNEIVRRGSLPTPGVWGAAALFPGLACDETAFIDAVANHVQFPIERWNATSSEPLDLLDPAVAQPSIRALFRSGTIRDVELARELCGSVILTGVGGDEIGTVGGIARDLLGDHQWVPAIEELLLYPGATRSGRFLRIRELLRPSLPMALRAWNSRAHVNPPGWLMPAFHPLAKDLAVPEPPSGSLGAQVAREVWQRVSSPRMQRVLSQFQEHGAAHGVRFRLPFLDQDLITFVLSLPYQHWPRQATNARFHREALAGLLPPKVRDRIGKAEFTPAVVRRIRDAQGPIRALLESGPWCSEPYVDRLEAVRLYRTVLSTNPVGSRPWLSLWSIVTLEAWLRAVFKYHSPESEAYRP
jgi:asparagine synthase (glutamine-hydrolysing)